MPGMFRPPECYTSLPYVEFCRNDSETQIYRSCLGEPCSRTVRPEASLKDALVDVSTGKRRDENADSETACDISLARADRSRCVRKRLRVSKNKDLEHPRYIFISNNCEKNIYHIPLAMNNPSETARNSRTISCNAKIIWKILLAVFSCLLPITINASWILSPFSFS